MTDQPNLIERLRQADRELKREQLAPAADRRLRELMERGEPEAEPSPSAWPRLAWVAVAAAAAVVLLVVWGPWRPTERPSPRRLAGFALASGRVHVEIDRGGVEALRCNSASCALVVPRLETRLELTAKAVVRRRAHQIELVRGRVTCEVVPRPKKTRREPVKVFVSHGVVEVMGTRFTLEQESLEGGRVTLHRGAIRFVSNDGRAVALRPGQQLSWPLAPEPPKDDPAPPVVTPDQGVKEPPPKTRPRPRPLDKEAMKALLERLERLRSQQRYARAARLLRTSLPRITDRTTRERLSYELGSILTNQLRDKPAACRHWQRHLRSFGDRRYGVEIAKARKMLGCSM